MTVALAPSEQRFVLENVDWALYESLLNGVGNRHVFLTYNRGRLELMSPSWKHDKRSARIAMLVWIVAEELKIPVESGGSTTFRREDVEAGLEPDQCFYVQNVDRVRGKDEIDLASDPPPDLAVEVEISRRMSEREEIYATLGIKELWRDDGAHLRGLILGTDGKYHQSEKSLAFPNLPLAEISELLNRGGEMDSTAWTTMVRQWVRKNIR